MDPNHATETQEFIVLTTECWSTHTVIHVLYNDGFSRMQRVHGYWSGRGCGGGR